ncbi:MAG: PhpK family radical SAM P-methyltransferase [Arenicella sp.]
MNHIIPNISTTDSQQAGTIDCLLIGFNDLDISHYEKMVRAMGTDSGAYRDLALAIVNHNGEPKRSLDLLTELHYEGREQPGRPLNNTDFLWPTITYLASFLHKRGFTYDFVNQFQFEKESLREKLQTGKVRSVAITTTLYVIPEPILEIIEFVREISPETQVIVGGPYVSNNTCTLDGEALQRFFKLIDADVYVDSSEGEQALVNVLTALRDGSGFEDILNIAFRRGEGYSKNPTKSESNDLSEEMVDHKLFVEDTGGFVSLRTAKSCPFNCAFCGFPTRAGKYLYLSVERVERELDALRELGTVSTITFLDDTFNVPKARFRDLLRMMIRNDYGFKWNSFYRSDHGDAETIELMAKAGCEGIFLGIESGSDTILEKMNKKSRAKHYREAISLCREHGIVTHANLIIGFPGETLETVQETIDLIEQTKPDFYRAQLWYADPMTPIWQKREELGITGEAFFWSHETMNSATACDLVEKLFLGIENSVWLPQFGFELWSVFYLKRFGMSVVQIKAFIRIFNALIKDKLLTGDLNAFDPQLMDALRTAAQFDRDGTVDTVGVEQRCGRAYMAAEAYWCGRFNSPSYARLFEQSNGNQATAPRQSEVALLPSTAAYLSDSSRAEPTAVASVATGLMRLLGVDDIAMQVVGQDGQTVPVRVQVEPSQTMEKFVDNINEQLQMAREYLRFSRHFLSNKERLAQYGATPPVFEVTMTTNGVAIDADAGLLVNFMLATPTPSIMVTLQDHDAELLAQQIAAILEQAVNEVDCLVSSVGETLVIPESTATNDADEAFQF